MDILEQASRLPADDKLRLIDRLIAELDLPDPAVERVWAEEAARRSQAVKRGELSVRPLSEALHKHTF